MIPEYPKDILRTSDYHNLKEENARLKSVLQWIELEIRHDDITAIRNKVIFLDFDELLTDISNKIKTVL